MADFDPTHPNNPRRSKFQSENKTTMNYGPPNVQNLIICIRFVCFISSVFVVLFSYVLVLFIFLFSFFKMSSAFCVSNMRQRLTFKWHFNAEKTPFRQILKRILSNYLEKSRTPCMAGVQKWNKFYSVWWPTRTIPNSWQCLIFHTKKIILITNNKNLKIILRTNNV